MAEILVADRVSLEATMAFKKLGMDMPETDDNPNEPKKIDGVPAGDGDVAGEENGDLRDGV